MSKKEGRVFENQSTQIRERNTSIPGTYCTEATTPTHPVPIGSVWWRWGHDGCTVEILSAYTMDGFRKLGLATTILDVISKTYPVKLFVTHQGNETSIPWLTKLGFTHCIERDVWELKVDLCSYFQRKAGE